MNKKSLVLLGFVATLTPLLGYEAEPFTSRSESQSDTLFTKIDPSTSGLQVHNAYADPEMWGEKYTEFQTGAVGTGLAAGDFDQDGLVDLYVAIKTGPNKLFRQTAPLEFTDVTESAGVAGGDAWTTGTTFADIDNDGDLDLYVCYFDAPNALYLNQGDGSFVESAASYGLDKKTGSVVGAFEDYDRDGDLDLFLLTSVLDATAHPEGEPDYLYQNNGDGTFTDVTEAAGIESDRGKGHSATWWDADGDGWADLFVSNDFEAPDHLYKNNGDGTFTEIRESALPHTAWYSMGSDFGDINNDGRLDLLSTDMANTTHFKSKVTMGDMGGWVDYFDTLVTPQYMKNAVFLNSGTHRFMEVAKMTGLSSTDWTWSPRFEDFDNDGWLDLHVTNGMVRSFTHSDMNNKIKTLTSKRQIIALVKNSPILNEKNLAFRNDGADSLHFSKVTKEWGLYHEGVSFGSIAADFDNDGDLDLVYSNYDAGLSFYRNDSQANSLIIELVGTRSNSHGIGAQVALESSQGSQLRKLTVARGVLSSSQPIAHFGLGSDEAASSVTVSWPSGETQTFENVAANQKLRIKEPNTGAVAQEPAPVFTPVKGLFAESSEKLGLDFARKEETFNDMERQSLLPHRMNTLGGGIAIGDADGDGDSDIYFSGATGATGALYLNDGKGRYAADARPQPWNDKMQVEEMAPLWIDINQDGKLDLYVSSGSVEVLTGDPALADNLYLNKGDGVFAAADPAAFPTPTISKSVVTAADFDRDGDLDLFVGGRVVPGEYPRAPRSALLVNDGGKLVDATDSLAPGLAESGMVTAALFTDANGDSQQDLLVLGELEAPKLMLNKDGKFVDASEQAGLATVKGWWNSLASADVDNDGDLDYVVGNLGLNTKYKANAAHPYRIYFNDFEGHGKCNIVEAKYSGDTLLPVRGRSCSSRAMPYIAKRFPTYHDYGLAELNVVYDPDKLAASLIKEVTELGTGLFINDGQGAFTFKRLPRLAQMAPVYGIAAADFDADGNIDLALAQNFNGPQVETGRYDGALSLLLLGDGKGNFRGTEAHESGIFIEDEARSLTIADLNSDGWPDLLATRPNAKTHAYLNGRTERNSLALVLVGKDVGNRSAFGSKLRVKYTDNSSRAFELAASSGYLSQHEAAIFLGYNSDNPPLYVEITWPDGTTSAQTLTATEPRLIIEQSASLELTAR